MAERRPRASGTQTAGGHLPALAAPGPSSITTIPPEKQRHGLLLSAGFLLAQTGKRRGLENCHTQQNKLTPPQRPPCKG